MDDCTALGLPALGADPEDDDEEDVVGACWGGDDDGCEGFSISAFSAATSGHSRFIAATAIAVEFGHARTLCPGTPKTWAAS